MCDVLHRLVRDRPSLGRRGRWRAGASMSTGVASRPRPVVKPNGCACAATSRSRGCSGRRAPPGLDSRGLADLGEVAREALGGCPAVVGEAHGAFTKESKDERTP